MTVYNPHDDSLVSDKIHTAGEKEVDAAVDAAKKAFKGDAWGKMDPTERAKCMRKFAELIRAKAPEIASLESKAMGSAVGTQTMGYNIAADLFDYYAGLADKIHGETAYPDSAGKYKIIQREPIGVCSGIGAWNVSGVLFSWKAAVSIEILGPLRGFWLTKLYSLPLLLATHFSTSHPRRHLLVPLPLAL